MFVSSPQRQLALEVNSPQHPGVRRVLMCRHSGQSITVSWVKPITGDNRASLESNRLLNRRYVCVVMMCAMMTSNNPFCFSVRHYC